MRRIPTNFDHFSTIKCGKWPHQYLSGSYFVFCRVAVIGLLWLTCNLFVWAPVGFKFCNLWYMETISTTFGEFWKLVDRSKKLFNIIAWTLCWLHCLTWFGALWFTHIFFSQTPFDLKLCGYFPWYMRMVPTKFDEFWRSTSCTKNLFKWCSDPDL